MSARSVIASGVAMMLAGCTTPGPCDRISERLDATMCAAAMALVLDEALPIPRGNAYADDEAAAELGFFNFYDKRFSRSGEVRCATCHVPEYAFQDKRQRSSGEGPGRRNSPSLFNAARHARFMWDGRADALWNQALIALENDVEMGSTRLALAHLVSSDPAIRGGYERAFGPMPDLTDVARFPLAGRPGDAAYEGMTSADQDLVNRVFVNLGKAFEAYVRRLAAGRSRVDDFLVGDTEALDAFEREGLAVFLESGCTDCHGGSILSDERFHDVSFPEASLTPPDLGREDGLVALASSAFTLTSAYADQVGLPAPTFDDGSSSTTRAFRTPSLRNVADSAPYGHAGTFPTLASVLEHHATELDVEARRALIAFFVALEGRAPSQPWSYWPLTPRP